jgi:single-strand DNA-binding protein
MASYSKTILVGRLGRDPELKATPSGMSVCRFSVATDETWKDKNGEKQKKTSWHNIVVWGKSAEVAEKYLRKGSEVLIEGKIEYREWEKDGVKRNATEIRCENFTMLGKATDRPEPHDAPAPAAPAAGGFDPDDDIPF